MTRRLTGLAGSFVSALFLSFCVLVLSPTPAHADTVRGRVRDPQDRPVAAAEVIVLRGQTVVATVRTANDGTFGPLTLPPGTYDIVVAAPGLRAAPQTITVTRDSSATVDVALSLAARSESVVVSASQIESTLSRGTDSVTVIDRAELDARQTETVADALRVVPGFTIAQQGGRGALTSIFPRGGESDYTLVLVDGIQQNTFGGGFDAAHLATMDVDRIEVVRGPQSALFGNGAVGGLVHVITRQGGPLRAAGLVEGGGYGTFRTALSGTGSSGPWQFGASVDGLATDGDTSARENLGGTHVTNNDYDRAEVAGGVTWSDRANRRIRIDARTGRSEFGAPGPYGSDPMARYGGIDTISRNHNTTRQVGAAATFGDAAVFRHRASFTWADLKSRFVSPSFFDPTVANDPTFDRTRRVTARYQLDLDRSRTGISAGVEFMHERSDNSFVTSTDFDTKLPIDRGVTGLFVEARPSIHEHAFITAGLRVERISRDALESDGFSRPPVLDADVVWSVNPKVSAAWFVQPTTKIRFGAGTGIKPPTTFDIGFTNNPNLKPERSKSFDVGIEQSLAPGAVVFDATFFNNRYDDLIVAVPVAIRGTQGYRTDNIANASARGLEIGVAARTVQGFSIRGSWTFLHTEVLGDDGLETAAPSPYKVGEPLVRRPSQQGSLEIGWDRSRTHLFATVNGRGKVADTEPNFGSPVFQNPGFAVMALGGSYRLSSRFEVTGRVSNLFDRQYEEVFGFPSLGRTASIGIRVATGR